MYKRRYDFNKLLTLFVFISLLISIVFIIYRIFTAPDRDIIGDAEIERVKSDYFLMLIQSVLGLIIMFLPGIITKKFSVEIPNMMHIMFIIFLYCAIYLGEVRSFYYHFRYWDVLLHGFGSAMLGALGFSFVTLLNKSERIHFNLSHL